MKNPKFVVKVKDWEELHPSLQGGVMIACFFAGLLGFCIGCGVAQLFVFRGPWG